MTGRTDSPVSFFLASVIAHAADAEDPKIDRLALIAADLLGKLQARRDYVCVAERMGFSHDDDADHGSDEGPGGGIAHDVLARGQAALDSDAPDIGSIAAGIAAARRLIAADERDHKFGSCSANVAMWRAMAGVGNPPPAGLVGAFLPGEAAR